MVDLSVCYVCWWGRGVIRERKEGYKIWYDRSGLINTAFRLAMRHGAGDMFVTSLFYSLALG